MANILDLTLLREFSQIFVWILIFVVSYGILQAANIFHSKGLHALIAVALTVLIGTTGSTSVLTSMIPWFVVLGFFLVFILILGQFIGLKQTDVLSVFGGKGTIWYIFAILAIGTVIALISAGQHSEGNKNRVLPDGVIEEAGEAASPTPGQTVINVLTNPKILGLILILAIAAITVALMAGGSGGMA